MNDVVICVENITKEYRLGTINYGTLYQDIQSKLAKFRNREDPNAKVNSSNRIRNNNTNNQFTALNRVSFDIHRGEIVGIIGRNGAGKSTLLKILSRVTNPTNGSVKIKGRIASLLEVGTGFHPELTGRENIFLNGAILGLQKREIELKFDDIVSFSEIDKFIDTPVKRYSSGMYVRLAFAVAAHLDPEILIVDEVLAVGDSKFQNKCLGKMGDLSKGDGKTVIIVSHNMGIISSLCNRGILLNNGSIVKDSTVDECISAYQLDQQNLKTTKNLADIQRISKYTCEAKIIDFSIYNENSNSEIIYSDKPCIAELVFEVFEDNVSVGGEFTISDGIQKIFLFHSGFRNNLNPILNKGIHRLICQTNPLCLYSGEYYISVALSSPGIPIDYIENAITINVIFPIPRGSIYEYKKYPGLNNVFIDHQWKLE